MITASFIAAAAAAACGSCLMLLLLLLPHVLSLTLGFSQ